MNVKHFSEKYTADQASAEYGAEILFYVQPDKTVPQQYVGKLVPNLCKGTDVCDNGTLNYSFNEVVDASTRNCFRHCWM